MVNQSSFVSDFKSGLFWERFAFLFGRMLILFALACIPLIFYTMTWRHYTVPKCASMQFIALLLVACWAIIACGRRFISSAIAVPAAFLFMTNVISCLAAVNLTESWERISFFAACLTVMVLVPKFFTHRKDFEVAAYILGFVCILVDLYGFAQKFEWTFFFQITDRWGIQKFNTPKPVSFMGNENFTCEFLNITLPICFSMMLFHIKRPAQLIFFSTVTILNSVNVYFIDDNAAFAGFLVGTPMVFIVLIYYKFIPWLINLEVFPISRTTLERWVRHGLVFMVLGLAVLITLLTSTSNKVRMKIISACTWIDVDGDHRPDGIAPVVFRLQCMDASIQKIKHSFWLGIGPGNFKVIHPRFETQLERVVLGEETLSREAHNDHLHNASETGVFGQFAWYWVILFSCVLIMRSFRILRAQEFDISGEVIDEATAKHILSPYERNFYFYMQWGILWGVLVSFVSCAYGMTFIIPGSTSTYWLVTGICTAVFQVLNRAARGVPRPFLGTIQKPLTPIQNIMKFSPVSLRWVIFFALILPFGALNTCQLLGELWLRQGMLIRENTTASNQPPDYSKVFFCFRNALHYYPYQMEIFYILGRYYIDALADFDSFSKGGEEGLKKLHYSGLMDIGRDALLEQGIVTLQTDIFMNPIYKWAHNNLGVLYDKMPNFKLSNEAYQRVLDIDRQQIFAHYNLGLGHMRQGQWESAIEQLEQALISDPSKTEIYMYLASCYAGLKDHKRAIAATDKYVSLLIKSQIQKALESQPKSKYESIIQHVEQRDLLPAMQEAQKLFQFESEECYRLYLTIASDLVNSTTRDYNTALIAMQRAEKSLPIPPAQEFYLLFGNIYYSLKDYVNAAWKYEEYLRLNPDKMDIRRLLTDTYLHMNRYELAEKTYAKIIESKSATWKDYLSYSRILVGLQKPWDTTFAFVRKSVELGGDEARKMIAEDDAENLLKPYVNDSRFRELMGAFYRPAAIPASSTQSNGSGTLPAPPPAAATSASTPSASPGVTESIPGNASLPNVSETSNVK